jgi:hypothetical protein
VRASRVLGIESGKAFTPKVQYIYRKQLEEADIVVLNKCDLVDRARLDSLEAALRECCPAALVLRVSAREGTGLDRWFAALSADPGAPMPPEVDYDVYAEGEARLGWLNGAVSVSAGEPFDGNRLLVDLARGIRGALAAKSIEIAHLKMTLAPDDIAAHPAALNLVSTALEPELPRALECRLSHGELLLNLRAEAPPETLRAAVETAMAGTTQAAGAHALVRHIECFSPARPTPTHRLIGV